MLAGNIKTSVESWLRIKTLPLFISPLWCFQKKIASLCPCGNSAGSYGFEMGKYKDTEGFNQCFNNMTQNNWGGCSLFTWVNLISIVGG